MIRPFQIEGGQKQFYSDSTDKIVQSWLHIESTLKDGVRTISARNLPAKFSELAEVFDNYRAIGWSVGVAKNCVVFEAEALPRINISYKLLVEKITGLRDLVQNGTFIYEYVGELQELIPDRFPTTHPDIACLTKLDETKGRLKIVKRNLEIEPWYHFVQSINYHGEVYFVFKL